MITGAKKIMIAFIVLSVFLFIGIGSGINAYAESEELEHKNKLGIFGGIAQESSEIGGSLGLRYEYLFTEGIGFGGILEGAFGGVDRSWLAAAPFYFHPYDEWYIALAPGLEFEGGDRNILLRVGVGYEFEFKPQWSLAPEFNVDFTDGDTKFVYGFAIFYSF